MDKSKNPIEFGNIKDRGLTQEIRTSYLDYAMSVIVSRALPDARDGLKPVQRRILFTMKNLGLGGSAKSKKSAAIVGDTLGKYHPHGDTSVYDALVRMAQTFSLRYPLVKGQGNFGSIDGDSAAAMRYTEAKLTFLADELFDDIDKDTVDFRDNYNGECKEPTVLPTKVPTLLLNGTTGIAVGMATNIPPHNLTEVMQALLHLSDNPEASLDDLLKFVKGPDFPTAGIAYGGKHIKEAYATGRGRVLTRGKMESVEKNGKDMLLITEIPYGVNKAEMIKKIASLVENKKIIGIKDLRDESDEKIRVVIDLKNGASPQRIMNQLYRYTDMEKYFYYNCISLVENGLQPKLLSLKAILEEFICFRKQVITRRTKFLLKKCQDRLHILDGLKTALDAIDEIIKIIKKSENKEDARNQLMKKFKFSEIQANAILEIKLQALAKLERFKIDNEIKEKNDLIKEYESILNSEKKLIKVMKGEFEYIVEKFGDERKTIIKNNLPTEISDMDLIPEKDVLLTISSSGYIKRMNNELFKTQHRGGKGVMMFGSKDSEDVLEKILSVNTKDKLWFFTNKGKVYEALTYDIEESSRTARGKAIQNFINIDTSENINSVLKYSDLENNKFLIMITKEGIIKKTKIDQFSNIRKTGLLTIRLDKDDSLVKADFSSGDDDIVIVTKKGQAIYMSEKDVRAMGRSAGGVCGIKLAKDDIVIGMGVVRKNDSKSKVALLTVSENGYGKKTYVKDYRYQKRGGVGSRTFHITDKTGELASAKLVDTHELMFVVSKKGLSIQVELKDVPILSRSTQGVKLMSLNKGDNVSQVEIL